MIDLSNNNDGKIDFEKVFAVGHRRVYLKATEGTSFVDATYAPRRHNANKAKLLTGAYHFAHGKASPKEEADHFLSTIGKLHPSLDLRPCLDLEYGSGSPALGAWARAWLTYVRQHVGVTPVLYSYASFVSACGFTTRVAPLWLAAYGRNDGVEHPFVTPKPWTQASVAAHQYASQAKVPGVEGFTDLSHVFSFAAFQLPPAV